MLETVTSESLLAGLMDAANRTVWRQFVERYRPTIVRYLRRLGLQPPDAEDVAQEALLAFSKAYREGRYDPNRGRLRSWMPGITRNVLRSWYRAERRADRPVLGRDSLASEWLDGVAADDELERVWEQEWRAAVLRACLEEVRPEFHEQTLEAFELFAREGLPAREVASRLGMTENAVFLAKRRVLRRLREILPEMERIW